MTSSIRLPSRGGEELPWFFECTHVEATRAGATGIPHRIVGSGESGERIEQQHDVPSGLNQAAGPFDRQIGDAHVAFHLLVIR